MYIYLFSFANIPVTCFVFSIICHHSNQHLNTKRIMSGNREANKKSNENENPFKELSKDLLWEMKAERNLKRGGHLFPEWMNDWLKVISNNGN